MKKKLFISTAIDYVNGSPHIGHALEKIEADVLARYHRSLDEDVFFLYGTDENSLKNVKAARKEKLEIKDLVDRNAKKFLALKGALNLSFDDFIRTTEERHIKGAEKLWLACKKDIYKKIYRGLYCEGCEEFFKEEELENGLCPEHKKKPAVVEEENYFFKLSKYQNQLKDLILKDKIKIIPKTRKNEVLSFVNQGLEDICISRSRERACGWGIEVPGDSSQIIWVWFDALSNYINALGYGDNSKDFKKWWQNNDNKLHIIGKGILRFHAVYWPAMLLSAGLELPNEIFVHSYITSDGQKMSKSLGNVVDPFDLVKKYGTDAVRYFLLREIPPFQDGDFTFEKFEKRYQSDLARGLGNLFSRVVSLAEKSKLHKESLSLDHVKGNEFYGKVEQTSNNYQKSLSEFKFNEALASVWELISFCDQYIEKEKVWQKTEKQRLCILCLLWTVSEIVKMLQPFLPETAEKILCQLNIESDKKKCLFAVKKGEPLFPKLS